MRSENLEQSTRSRSFSPPAVGPALVRRHQQSKTHSCQPLASLKCPRLPRSLAGWNLPRSNDAGGSDKIEGSWPVCVNLQRDRSRAVLVAPNAAQSNRRHSLQSLERHCRIYSVRPGPGKGKTMLHREAKIVHGPKSRYCPRALATIYLDFGYGLRSPAPSWQTNLRWCFCLRCIATPLMTPTPKT